MTLSTVLTLTALGLLLGVDLAGLPASAQVPEVPVPALEAPVSFGPGTPDESVWVFFFDEHAPAVVQPAGKPAADGTFSLVAVMVGLGVQDGQMVTLEIVQGVGSTFASAKADGHVGNDTASAEFRAQAGIEYILHLGARELRFRLSLDTSHCLLGGNEGLCPQPVCFLPFTCETPPAFCEVVPGDCALPNPCSVPFVCGPLPQPCQLVPGNCGVPDPCSVPFVCGPLPQPCQSVPGNCGVPDPCSVPFVCSPLPQPCQSVPGNCGVPDLCNVPFACGDVPDPDLCDVPLACGGGPDLCNIPFACGGGGGLPCLPFICGLGSSPAPSPAAPSAAASSNPPPNDPCGTFLEDANVHWDEDGEDFTRAADNARLYSAFGVSVDLTWDNACAYYRGQEPRSGTIGAVGSFYGPDHFTPGQTVDVDGTVAFQGIDQGYRGALSVIPSFGFGDAATLVRDGTNEYSDIDALQILGVHHVAVNGDEQDSTAGCGAWYDFLWLAVAAGTGGAAKLGKAAAVAVALGLGTAEISLENFVCPADYDASPLGQMLVVDPMKGFRGGVGTGSRTISGTFEAKASYQEGAFWTEMYVEMALRGSLWGYGSQASITFSNDPWFNDYRVAFVGDGEA